jgi:uncharacterized protein (DUF1015 family)
MTEVIPFRGIHFNREKVAGDEVVAPPYDVITPGMRESLYGLSPYNAVRVDFGEGLPGDGEGENRYTRASALLDGWLREGILKRSERPCFYVYRMDYGMRGERKSLTGFFGLVRLVELGEGVYPHEATHSRPKQDRLSLMQACSANTSPIYSLYRASGPDVSGTVSAAAQGSPYLKAVDADGAEHSLWVLDDPASVDRMKDALRSVSVFIADGHHRYETALAYRRAMREKTGSAGGREPFDYVMMFLADLDDPELTVLPTHRVVTVDAEDLGDKLSAYFDVETLAPDADIIEAISGRRSTFGLYAEGKRHALAYRGGDLKEVAPALQGLDVVVLHKLVFGKLLEVGSWAYEMDYAATMARVDGGEYDAAFFLNPTAVGDVERVALKSLRMPPKSTYFYPKVQTGFVMNSLKSF